MRKITRLILICVLLSAVFACKKETPNLSLEQVKYNTNKSSYPSTKMDSAQAINKITKQKVREVLELSILYKAGKQDTDIDSALYNQILGYFYKPDSLTVRNLLNELDSLQVGNARIGSFEVTERYFKKDTLNFARFDVQYYDRNNLPVGTFAREAQYVLVPAEIRFKKEFKFYFLNFYQQPILKDSTSSGVTR
ncbi:hypothetical protein J8J42_03430 [Chryseobacterium sp. cx-311]|uniref:hypothetical protein n=1 Tax=Marnyiella aurantia TaxID=2758037 RepID=UPI001AEB3D9B|nr:hypothetical protein [Marnyiella aurantia]MBP0612096.1 hypothetical protein [Marnyiella aurantia]